MGAVGATGPAGTTDWNGLTNVPAGFADNVDDNTTYTAGQGLSLSGTLFSIPGGAVTNAMVEDNTLTAAKIANRSRKLVISSGSFAGAGTTNGSVDFNVGNARNRGAAIQLPNDVANVATTVFVVPSDYVAGQPIPKITVFWATDEGAANRRCDIDVGFTHIANMSSPTSPVTFRYNFRDSSGSSTNASDCLNPAQSQVVGQTIPEDAEVYDNSPTAWAAGDVIILSVGRNGTSGGDPNSGNFYLYAISIEYSSDM